MRFGPGLKVFGTTLFNVGESFQQPQRWIFTEIAVEVTSITTLYAKAPEVLFDVRMMSPNNFLEGMEMKLAKTILAALCLEIIETLLGYLGLFSDRS